MLVSGIAVFIFLSVTFAEEATRCYWCGPLAEQVHRSQRAPSCDAIHLEHVTICDKGYTHCAIIASTPPYAESRVCVKFYQDECYSLYCNSTKTWRMVCVCKGDLCNGPNTDRETEAFAVIPRFLSKSKTRNKRTLISGFISVKTKAPSDNNTIIIINNKAKHNDTTYSIQRHQPPELNENSSNANIVMNDIPKPIEENIIIEHGTVNNVEKSIVTTSKAETEDGIKIHNTTPTMAVTEDKHLTNSEMDKPTTPTPSEFVKETLGSDTIASTSVKPTSIEIEVAVVNNKVTPDKLPPPEALQQNITPTKAIEHTTMATVVMSTEDNHMAETTKIPSKITNPMQKNSGTQNLMHRIIFTISNFLVHFYL